MSQSYEPFPPTKYNISIGYRSTRKNVLHNFNWHKYFSIKWFSLYLSLLSNRVNLGLCALSVIPVVRPHLFLVVMPRWRQMITQCAYSIQKNRRNQHFVEQSFLLSRDHLLPAIPHSLLGPGRFRFFNFGTIRFGFQSEVLGFGFFSFGICTPPQCNPSVWKH